MIKSRQRCMRLLLLLLCWTTVQLALTRAAPTDSLKVRKPAPAKNCAELYESRNQRISGVYTIDPDGEGAFDVYCDQTTAGGGWTVLQARQHGSVDFNRALDAYKHGFGDFLIKEFWLGLNKIHRLTRNRTKNRLRVELGVTTDKTVYAEYAWFRIGNERSCYLLNIGGYNSRRATVSDSLSALSNTSFGNFSCENGAAHWWNIPIGDGACTYPSNLNGAFPSNIHWAHLDLSNAGNNSPLKSEMKIRSVTFLET